MENIFELLIFKIRDNSHYCRIGHYYDTLPCSQLNLSSSLRAYTDKHQDILCKLNNKSAEDLLINELKLNTEKKVTGN